MTESKELEVDTPCMGCDYNLRGLLTSAICPECALPISLSLRRGLLCYSGSAYLATLQNALMFLIFATFISVGFQFLRLTTGVRDVWISVLCQLPALIGLWWLTTPAPRTVDTRHASVLRTLIRISLVISLLNSIYALAPYSALRWLPGRLVTLLTLAGYGGQVAAMLYLKLLANRLPNQKLARFATQLAVAIGAVALLSAGTHLAFDFLRTPWLFRLVQFHIFQITAWAMVVAGALSLLLLNSISRRVQEQLEKVERSERSERLHESS